MKDVIIVGGGPAGSTLGSYLSKAGVDNVILDRAIHPRPHVGESLVMSTVRIFDELEFIPVMERAGFVKKYGASWHEVRGRESAIRFSDFPQEGIRQEYTYHVDRSRFDLLLLKHAESLGSQVLQGVNARRVLFEGDRAVGVRVQILDKEIDLEGKIIVDASGRSTLLGNQLGIKQNDPIFNQYAVHAWFEGVERSKSDTEDYIHIYFLPVERGWGWKIPISDTVTSIGVVTEREVFKQFKGDMKTFFDHHVVTNDAFAADMALATRVTEFRSEGDYSYHMEKFVGENWLLVGDAARFVDPIFSSGVSVALTSAKFASEAIRNALQNPQAQETAFLTYEQTIKDGVSIWYEFIRLYYTLLPLFTKFIRKEEYRHDIHRLLQGEVFNRGEVPVLAAMRDYINIVEESENHIFHSRLMDIPLEDVFARRSPA
jgi:FADH2 O2-dependent halogenase